MSIVPLNVHPSLLLSNSSGGKFEELASIIQMIDKVFEESEIFGNKIDDEFTECDVELVWLDTKRAAKYLNIAVGSLRNLTGSGKVTYYKFGRKNLYQRKDLDALILSEKRGLGALT